MRAVTAVVAAEETAATIVKEGTLVEIEGVLYQFTEGGADWYNLWLRAKKPREWAHIALIRVAGGRYTDCPISYILTLRAWEVEKALSEP